MDLTKAPEPRRGLPGCSEYAALPCTREAIDDYLNRRADALRLPRAPIKPVYPDEWYADKDNRLAGRPLGRLRFENVGRGAVAVWVPNSNQRSGPDGASTTNDVHGACRS